MDYNSVMTKYMHSFTDRYGVVRHYVRIRGVHYPVVPDAPDFLDLYANILDQSERIPALAAYTGTVYVVGHGRFVKIGYTKSLAKRVARIQFSCPEQLSVLLSFPGSRERERLLHGRYAEYRTFGEWFERRGALADWIRREQKASKGMANPIGKPASESPKTAVFKAIV